MELTEQMEAAAIRNWLADLAIGAKAMAKSVDTSSTYENVVIDGVITVHVHRIVELAKKAELEVYHRDLEYGDFYFAHFISEDFVMFNGVKFCDMTLRPETLKKRKEKK